MQRKYFFCSLSYANELDWMGYGTFTYPFIEFKPDSVDYIDKNSENNILKIVKQKIFKKFTL